MIDKKLSLVIPVYQEGNHLQKSIKTIIEVISPLRLPYEVVLIDDGSRDNTWDSIIKLINEYSEVKGIQLSRNFGKEAALCAGLDFITGDACIVMDGDLQHPPELIPEMIRLWQEEGYDIVEAVKVSRGEEKLSSKLFSSIFYKLLNKLTGYDLTGASDYKLLDSKAIQAWRNMKERLTFFRGMTVWIGFRRCSLPFTVAPRVGGTTKWSFFTLFNLAKNAVTAFSTIPLHFITTIGVIFLICSVVLGINTLYQKVVGKAVDGFTTVIILLLIMGSILMIAFGIVGEYIARIYDEVKGRPRYVIRQTYEQTSMTSQDQISETKNYVEV